MLHKLELSELKALVAFTQILASPSYQKSSNWQRTAIPTRSSGSVSSGGESSDSGSCSSLKAESSSAQSSSEDAEVFTPELLQGDDEDKHKNTYRFVCPHAGQFRCSLTNLVFVMEGEGEVLYKTVSWDPRVLDGFGQMQPAGPLYNIDCFHGSILRLHLPHCEIFAPIECSTVRGKDADPPAHKRLTVFVKKHRDELIKRVLSVMAIADGLKTKDMIPDEIYSEVTVKYAAETRQEKARRLLDALDSGGASVKAEFYRLLKEIGEGT